MKQLISAATHMLQHSSSCINLIFVNQPNLVIDSCIHLSLHQNCHYQVILCKLNLKVEYPPPHAWEVWKKMTDSGKVDLIYRANDQFVGLTYF